MPSLLVERHRRDIADLAAIADRDLRILLRPIDDPVEARDLMLAAFPDLVSLYGSASATLAAEFYDEIRDEERISGRFRPAPAQLPGQVRTDSLARFAVGPMFDEVPDKVRTLDYATGGMQQLIADSSRYTITGASAADPQANGWQRTGSGSCGFCAMLISRGAIYTEDTAAFGAHRNCNCSAVPAFRGRPKPVEPYTPSERRVTDADRARVREWQKANGY